MLALVLSVALTSAFTGAFTLQPPTPEVLPVGVYVNGGPVLSSTLVLGQLDASLQAVALENWLLPFNDVVRALDLTTTELAASAETEVRGEFIVARIPASELRAAPELGERAIRVADLEARLGVEVRFDVGEFAVDIGVPRVARARPRPTTDIVLTGLPRRTPPLFTVTALRQLNSATLVPRFGLTNSTDVVGSLFGGSYFVSLDQPRRRDLSDVRLDELQYLYLRDDFDLVVGDQKSLWDEPDLFGVGAVLRFDLLPAAPRTGSYDPLRRFQTREFSRTISGVTEAGTLVRLVPRGEEFPVIAEELVGADGVYRFEDVVFGAERYDVLLYPGGRLAAEPLRQTPSPPPLAVLIPEDAIALSLAAGTRRGGNTFFGEVSEPVGGATFRRGIRDDFTLGVGAFYDDGVRLRGEAYYAPYEQPLSLQAAINTPGHDERWSYDLRFDYRPRSDLSFNADADELRQRFRVRYRPLPQLTLQGDYSVQTGVEVGPAFRVRVPLGDALTVPLSGEVTWSQRYGLRWRLDASTRYRDIDYTLRLNDQGAFAQLNYEFDALSGVNEVGITSTLSFLNTRTYSVTPYYRYASGDRLRDNSDPLSAEVAYTFGNNPGARLELSASLTPGLRLGTFYSGNFGRNDSVGLSLEGRFILQNRPTPADVVVDDLRTQGGLRVQPFLDRNGNGVRDRDEGVYLDNLDLLLELDRAPIRLDRDAQIGADYVTIPLPVGAYRLDLDPAGFPLDFQPAQTSYAVTVRPGSYTTLAIPFRPSYTVLGVLTDTGGTPLGSVRVEAIRDDNRIVSVTNGAGVFVLEGLGQGRYALFANGDPVAPSTLTIDETSEPFFEVAVVKE